MYSEDNGIYVEKDITKEEYQEKLAQQKLEPEHASICEKCGCAINSHQHVRCSVCRWCICPKCGACDPDCRNEKVQI